MGGVACSRPLQLVGSVRAQQPLQQPHPSPVLGCSNLRSSSLWKTTSYSQAYSQLAARDLPPDLRPATFAAAWRGAAEGAPREAACCELGWTGCHCALKSGLGSILFSQAPSSEAFAAPGCRGMRMHGPATWSNIDTKWSFLLRFRNWLVVAEFPYAGVETG